MTQEKQSTSIRVDADTKKKATTIFRALGLDFSSGIEVYLRAVVREQRIPFDLALSAEKNED